MAMQSYWIFLNSI